jgi:hypothetical protein
MNLASVMRKASRGLLIGALGGWVVGLLATVAVAQETGKPSADALAVTAQAIAGDLMSNLGPAAAAGPGGRLKIAVRPFSADEVANLGMAEQLNSDVEASLKASGGDHVIIVERAAFAKVWAEANEFQGTDPTDRFRGAMRDAGADVLVFGRISAASEGYTVEYRAVDVRVSGTGAALAFTREPRLLKATFAARRPLTLDDAIFQAARRLSRQLVAVTKMSGDTITVSHSGERSDMADLLLNQLENRLQDQIPEALKRAGSGAQAFTGDAPAPSGPTEIAISAKPIERAGWLEVRFEAQAKERGGRTATTVEISKNDPAFRGLLPLNRNGPFEASAEAVVKGALDHDAAARAARALARAAVIAQKSTPLVDDTPVMVNGLTDGATAMQAIAGGITTDEQWVMQDLDGGKRVRADLIAKVKALGGGDAPIVHAVISSPVVENGKPFALTLSSAATAYVAVFDWSSDDLVLRVFPYARHPPVVLAPGVPVTLPRKGEQPFSSDLRSGASADFEGLIVVASSQPLNYDQIAMEPASTFEESLQRAVPIGRVFDALAKLPGNISVTIVPYQLVSAPGATQ